MKTRTKEAQRSFPDLKAWRYELRISQAEAARRLGISQKSYSRFELGQRYVKGPLAKRLMARTGVPLEVLAGVAA